MYTIKKNIIMSESKKTRGEIGLIIDAYKAVLALFKNSKTVEEMMQNGRVEFDDKETAVLFMDLYNSEYGEGMYMGEEDGAFVVHSLDIEL